MAGGDGRRVRERSRADLFSRLDAAFAHQQRLDPRVLASVRAWQRLDRTYELIQCLVRGAKAVDATTGDVRRAETVRRHLDVAIASGRVPFDVVVYRGLRDLRRVIRVKHPSETIGARLRLTGYTATTISKAVALEEFTRERGLLLQIAVPAGTPALWIAGVGDPKLRRQGELLLRDGIGLQVYSLGRYGRVPVLSGEAVIE